MSDMLNAVFYSFWTFLGTALLLGIVLNGVARIILATRGIAPKCKCDE